MANSSQEALDEAMADVKAAEERTSSEKSVEETAEDFRKKELEGH